MRYLILIVFLIGCGEVKQKPTPSPTEITKFYNRHNITIYNKDLLPSAQYFVDQYLLYHGKEFVAQKPIFFILIESNKVTTKCGRVRLASGVHGIGIGVTDAKFGKWGFMNAMLNCYYLGHHVAFKSKVIGMKLSERSRMDFHYFWERVKGKPTQKSEREEFFDTHGIEVRDRRLLKGAKKFIEEYEEHFGESFVSNMPIVFKKANYKNFDVVCGEGRLANGDKALIIEVVDKKFSTFGFGMSMFTCYYLDSHNLKGYGMVGFEVNSNAVIVWDNIWKIVKQRGVR